MLYFNERRHDPMTLEVRDVFRDQNRSSDWDSPTCLFIIISSSALSMTNAPQLYPDGNTSFSLYEDDGVTRQVSETFVRSRRRRCSPFTRVCQRFRRPRHHNHPFIF
eukprot:COSAG05_NODE_11460_length_512_cov_1.087167_1_plen_106_part_10